MEGYFPNFLFCPPEPKCVFFLMFLADSDVGLENLLCRMDHGLNFFHCVGI